MSPACKNMLGYEDHELPDSPDTRRSLIFPEDLPGVLKVLDRHIKSRGEIPYYNKVRFRRKDGSTVWVIRSGSVIEWDAAGGPLRMPGCHVDTADRK